MFFSTFILVLVKCVNQVPNKHILKFETKWTWHRKNIQGG